jgi:plastocyanin
MSTHASCFLIVLAVFGIPSAFGVEVTGKVKLLESARDRKPVVVVYAEQLGEHEPPKPGHYELKQQGKMFIPHVLAVPVGSTVTFPNEDPIFHNVFSLTRPGPFDLGLYRSGDSKTRVFTKPATYRVFCNIHPQMTALLLVLPTPFIAEVGSGGAYRLDLPPGRYRLVAWSEHSEPAGEELVVETNSTSAPEMTLDESKFVEIPHKNKYGQDYPASAYEAGKR